MRGVEHVAAVVLLLLVAVSAGVIVYVWLTGFTSKGASSTAGLQQLTRGKAVIEAVKVGPGYIAVYVRGVSGDPYIDTVYLVSPSGSLLAVIKLPAKVRVEPGRVSVVYIPVILFRGKIPQGPVYLKLGSSTGVVASTEKPINLGYYIQEAMSQLSIGIFVDRGGAWNYGSIALDTVLNVTPGLIYDHAIILNPLTGVYQYLYSSGVSLYSGEEGSGVTTLVTLSTQLPAPLSTYITINSTTFSADLYDLYYSVGAAEYKQLMYKYFGPFIVILNPQWGVGNFTVYIHGVFGDTRLYDFSPVASSKYDVAVDLIILYEDLWTPAQLYTLDNYVDHVLRVTVFTNGTIAVWVYHCSGGYLHALFLDPPSFTDMLNSVKVYENCTVTWAELVASPSLATIGSLGGNEAAAKAAGLLYLKPHSWDTDAGQGVFVPYGSGEILTAVPIRVK